ncbi:VanZ family protein [Alphaproteobacteria bacterium]|nr:VanZ family protein [Alphaproteobacteria bacterium]
MDKIFKIFSLFYLVIITIAFLIPVNSIAPSNAQPSNNTSYFIHIILLFFLYLLFFVSFKNKNKILIFCLSYSLLIEVMQIFSSRGFQFFDIISNLIGVLIAFIFCFMLSFLDIKNKYEN